MTKKILPLWLLITLVYGCGGGGGSNPPPDNPVQLSASLSGGGVKGPLANAAFALYKFDSTYTNFQAATAASSGRTTSQAKFSITIPTADLDPPYLIVFTADDNTTDLMTGGAPLITNMKTVVTQEMLDSGANIYATPLTTIAIDVAIENTLSNREPYASDADYSSATTLEGRFLAALPIAAQQVKSTLGFGLSDDIDIYTTPPIVDSSTDDDTKLNNTAQYRGAVEALGAVVAQLRTQVSESIGEVDNNTVIEALVSDLSDGQIDGVDSYGKTINVLPDAVRTTLKDIDPQSLNVPGTDRTVAQMTEQLASETSQTGNTGTSTTSLTNATITITTQPAQTNPDQDGDGVLNSNDAFPDDATADKDTDHDGKPDVAYTDSGRGTIDTARSDDDDDNDGWADVDDDYPTDATKHLDPALDRDGDTTANGVDICPLDANNTCADEGTLDSDGDGVPDSTDNCPTMSNPAQIDTDGDYVFGSTDPSTGGNVCDNDDDGDGVLDANDAFPLDSTETLDTDHDGIGDNTDTDDDNDGVLDVNEVSGCSLLRDCDGDGRMDKNDAFPLNPKEWIDTDGDCGTIITQTLTSGDDCSLDGNSNQQGGNNADTDDDNDGVVDTSDAFPLDSMRSANIVDADADGFDDNTADNCLGLYNPLQKDRDADGMGDLCDTDDDGDGVLDVNDAYPLDPTADTDTDHDGKPDVAYTDAGRGTIDTARSDTDDDNDGVLDVNDAFPLNPLESVDTDGDCGAISIQTTISGNGCGNNTDTDDDGDGVLDVNEVATQCQLLADCDGDTVGDATDLYPLDSTESADADGDGMGNNADNCPNNANADQLNTDGAADGGNACDTDDDNDAVLDVNDAFPLNSSESVDTDSDCGTITTQTTTSGNGCGDNTDTDDDGDGVLDVNEAATQCRLLVDCDSDTVSDATDNCPLVSNVSQTDTNSNGIGDACDGATSGAYSLTHTTTAHTETTEPTTGWCWSAEDAARLNVAETGYIPVNVTGNTITIDGYITGTVNTDGTFTATGDEIRQESYFNGSNDVPFTLTSSLTLTGTATGTTVSGTFTEAQTATSLLDCGSSGTFSGSLAYAPTATENYDSVYALELDASHDDRITQGQVNVREAYALEMDFGSSTVNLFDVYSKTDSSSFDPVSGGFKITTSEEDVRDENGDGYDDLVRNVNTISGVMIAAPNSATPELWLDNVEGENFIYLGDISGAPTYTGQTEDFRKWDFHGKGYGKMVATNAYNNVFTNPVSGSSATQDQDFLGLQNPPLGLAAGVGKLYFAAYAGATATGTALCTATYDSRLQWRADLPRPDFTVMAMRTSPYSYVNCPLSAGTVTAGNQYTLVVRDDNGTAGDVADDVDVYSMVHTATVSAAYPGVKQNRRTLSFAGATASKTEAGEFIPVSGYFNPAADMTISWPAVSSADQYSVRVWDYDSMNGKDNSEIRMTTSGTSVTLPAHSVNNMMAVRLMARYSSSSDRAYSQSKHVILVPGINGLVNVELAHSSGGFSIFQLDLNTGKDSFGNMTIFCGETTEQGVNCSSTGNAIDWTTDTVSLAMVDNWGDITGSVGGTFTLSLAFTNAVNATATTSVAGWSGVARVVTTELVAMNRARPGATNNKSTQLVLQNSPPFYGMGVLTTASGTTLLDGVSATSKTFWDGMTTPYADVGNSFKVFPVGDGEAQFNGGYVSYDSYEVASAELVLADDQYRFTVSGHPFGLPDRTFKVDYTYADPTDTVGGPLRTAITYNSTAASTGNTVANAIDVTTSGPTQFTLTWTDSLPSTTLWRVMVQLVDASGNPVPHADLRTKQLDAAVDVELTESAGTWTWGNTTSLIDLGLLSSGETARIILDSRTPDGTMRGTSQPFYVKKP